MAGWIKVHRKLMEHPFYQEKRTYSKLEAWLDLLLLASYEDKQIMLGNEIIDIEKGSFITSEYKLMERWKWSKTRVRTFLELLQNEKMIERKADRKKTTINIDNYSVYQGYETEKELLKDRQETTERLQKNPTKKLRSKELKEYTSDFETFWGAYPKKAGKQRAFECWLARIKEDVSAETLILAAENYTKQCRADQTESKYIKHPSTFLSAKRDYEDHLTSNVVDFKKKRTPIYDAEDWTFQMPKTDKLRMFD